MKRATFGMEAVGDVDVTDIRIHLGVTFTQELRAGSNAIVKGR